MGSTYDYVPTQLTKAFREAQSDKRFRGWLKMQEAAVEIVLPYEDMPELRGQMFTEASLDLVEAKLISLYENNRAAYAGDDNIHRTMRFVYYIGETFRRAFEGTWVAIPPKDDADKKTPSPGIDLPFSEGFIEPTTLILYALLRRSGMEISRVYGFQQRAYNEWVEAGRPDREYLGTLREG